MHDPLVVAFEIRRPWPCRSRPVHRDRRWDWSPPFATVAGRGLYWPTMITVWHREPDGHDSGEICKHYVRTQGPDGTWQTQLLDGWRFHVHHWRIQVGPLQLLRRRLLTRCAWCLGRSTKAQPVNVSNSWDAPRGQWWRGERHLFHLECSAASSAHRQCTCLDPVCADESAEYGPYGRCARCGMGRSFGVSDEAREYLHRMAQVPAGVKPEPR